MKPIEHYTALFRYHHELQEMWYRAHYHEAEKIRARPLGEYSSSVLAAAYSDVLCLRLL